MQNYKLVIAYDGTNYLGWQKTSGPSIEGTLQNILEQILQVSIQLQAASRTDAGVHAAGQVVNFLIDSSASNDTSKLQFSLNSLLPKDIRILSLSCESASFHPTCDCTGKVYHYALRYAPIQMPQERFYEWHYPYELDVPAMKRAAAYLVGTHNFAAFGNARYLDCVRTIFSIEIQEEEKDKRLEFLIAGNRFLYKMVRNIVGTLVFVGRGKILEKEIPEILASGDRNRAGVTAPAHGLTLKRVNY